MLCQTLFHTLKLAPHERPSSQPLTKNPQQLCYFLCQTLTKDPQQVWQTLKNFDYPKDVSLGKHLFYDLRFYYLFEFFKKSGMVISTGFTLASGFCGFWIPEKEVGVVTDAVGLTGVWLVCNPAAVVGLAALMSFI